MSVNGTYTLEKNENIEAFLTAIGLKEEKVQKIVVAKPTVTLTLDGGKLTVESKGALGEGNNVLIIGKPSPYTLAPGFDLEVVLNISGNKGTGTLKKGDRSGEFNLSFTDSHLTEEFVIEGHTCKRIYKRS